MEYNIVELLDTLEEINEKNFAILDRLCKKICVTKRVLRVYDKDFLTMSEHETPLSESEYQKLASILLYWVKETKDAKFLNSCLKLSDLLQDTTLRQKCEVLVGDIV